MATLSLQQWQAERETDALQNKVEPGLQSRCKREPAGNNGDGDRLFSRKDAQQGTQWHVIVCKTVA
jgi:hypothetical protein